MKREIFVIMPLHLFPSLSNLSSHTEIMNTCPLMGCHSEGAERLREREMICYIFVFQKDGTEKKIRPDKMFLFFALSQVTLSCKILLLFLLLDNVVFFSGFYLAASRKFHDKTPPLRRRVDIFLRPKCRKKKLNKKKREKKIN